MGGVKHDLRRDDTCAAAIYPSPGASRPLTLRGCGDVRPAWESFGTDVVAGLVDEQLPAVLRPLRGALPDMTARGTGCVVLIGSGMSREPQEGFGPLSVAKGAADACARSLALELGPRGIRVNVVAPGFAETDTSGRFVPPEASQAVAAASGPLLHDHRTGLRPRRESRQ